MMRTPSPLVAAIAAMSATGTPGLDIVSMYLTRAGRSHAAWSLTSRWTTSIPNRRKRSSAKAYVAP